MGLNLALVAALIAVGITARSLAVFAEGGDYLLDAVGIGIAIFAARLSAAQSSREPGKRNPNSVAALINAGWLLAVEILVAAAAADRLLTKTPEVSGLAVLIVSAVAAIVMTAGALVLHGSSGEDDDDADLSVAAVLLDTAADAAAAGVVAVVGAIILAVHGLFWLDPLAALLVAAAISWHAMALIKKVLARDAPKEARTAH
jgi:cobalt-zinc-cadmium efflux system protein